MIRTGLLAGIGLVLLTGCQDGGGYVDEAVDTDVAMEIAPPGPADAPQSVMITPASTPAPVGVPRVAYVYLYGLEVPVDRAVDLMGRHEAACVAAGAATCQVIGAETQRYGRDEVTSRLTLRATPTWIARFRSSLEGEAEAAGGRIASSATQSEDLTRSLIDSEARLRAQTTLRDRLQGLLATRSGSLEELLKVESELARVQGEIDSVQSNLAEMRTRVATSRLEISYSAAGQLAPDSAFRPAQDAVDGALHAFMMSVGALIWTAALLAPIALIVVPLAWWWVKRRKKKAGRRAPSPPAGEGGSRKADG